MNARAAGLAKETDRLHGIKGPTPLLELEDFDFQRSFTTDYLHSVCLGVIRYKLYLIINAKVGDAWYISKIGMNLLKIRLQQIKPPYEITRSQFNLENIKDWKASQFRAFALYFVTAFEGILPEPYYSHFCSLSYGLFVLLQERVKKSAVKKLDGLFTSYVRDVDHIYGPEHVTYNFHLLLHLSKTCLDWGLAYEHATWIPEWFNGQLASSPSGTQCIAEQMASNFIMQNMLRHEATSLLEKHRLPKNVLDLLSEIICLPAGEHKKFNIANGMQVGNIKFLGSATTRKLTEEENIAVVQYYRHLQLPLTVDSDWEFYSRLILKHGSIFTTKSYNRSPNRINYCALMKDANFVFIENIAVNRATSKCLLIAKVLGSIAITVQHPINYNSSTQFEKISGQTSKFEGTNGSLVVYHAEEIATKGILSSYNEISDKGFVTALSNRLETD